MAEVTDEQIRLLAVGISRDHYDRNSGDAYKRAGKILGANEDQVKRVAREDSDWPQGRG